MIIIVFSIALISAIGWHSLIKNYWASSIGSTVTTILLTWVIASGHIGFLDWQFVKNISIIGFIAFIVAMVVGRIFISLDSQGRKK